MSNDQFQQKVWNLVHSYVPKISNAQAQNVSAADLVNLALEFYSDLEQEQDEEQARRGLSAPELFIYEAVDKEQDPLSPKTNPLTTIEDLFLKAHVALAEKQLKIIRNMQSEISEKLPAPAVALADHLAAMERLTQTSEREKKAGFISEARKTMEAAFIRGIQEWKIAMEMSRDRTVDGVEPLKGADTEIAALMALAKKCDLNTDIIMAATTPVPPPRGPEPEA